MQSDTPRTDANVWVTRVEVDDPEFGLVVVEEHVVDADFARQLERELAALVAERDALREQLRLANIDQFNTEAEANERDRDLRERDETRGQTWYLLYGGTSEDGMGSGPYIGRTTDKEVARDHHAKCRKNPYSIGFVEIVTDTEKKRVSYYGRELETKKEGGGANAK